MHNSWFLMTSAFYYCCYCSVFYLILFCYLLLLLLLLLFHLLFYLMNVLFLHHIIGPPTKIFYKDKIGIWATFVSCFLLCVFLWRLCFFARVSRPTSQADRFCGDNTPDILSSTQKFSTLSFVFTKQHIWYTFKTNNSNNL